MKKFRGFFDLFKQPSMTLEQRKKYYDETKRELEQRNKMKKQKNQAQQQQQKQMKQLQEKKQPVQSVPRNPIITSVKVMQHFLQFKLFT